MQVKAAMIFLLLLVATAREIIMQMKGTWLMKDVLEVTTMVKRYHDADLRFVFVVAAGRLDEPTHT